MLISLSVFSGVIAIAAHMASAQLRFFRGLSDIVELRGQVGHASAIVASIVWSASPGAGDIVVAQDTVLEVRMTTGAAVVCASAPGRIVIPAATQHRGNVLAGYTESPEAGDRVAALFSDSLGSTWLGLRASSSPASGGDCATFPAVTATWTLMLAEPIMLPVGTPLRFLRPLRLSLYRASDGRWYLGARDWNGGSDQFNTIQPVAGPLRPPSADAARSGLRFVYRNGSGEALPAPADAGAIASVSVISRAESARLVRVPGVNGSAASLYIDSSVVVVALRNAQ